MTLNPIKTRVSFPEVFRSPSAQGPGIFGKSPENPALLASGGAVEDNAAATWRRGLLRFQELLSHASPHARVIRLEELAPCVDPFDAVSFPYSVENPPPLAELESKLLAVHATHFLPQNGTILARVCDFANLFQGEEPPSFRPTIHFSLGELVQPHEHEGGKVQFSWEEAPFAIVTPLGNLRRQIVNLLPHDTFVLGDFSLGEETLLLVPEGVDVSGIPAQVPVLRYRGSLRTAVKTLVAKLGGWTVDMKPGGANHGAIAEIAGRDINRPDFFGAMLEALPGLSYGVHPHSERGEIGRMGAVEGLLQHTMRSFAYSDRASVAELRLNRALIFHHLERLEVWLRARGLPDSAMVAFEEKKRRLRGWMNIVDLDIELQERKGRTLQGFEGLLAMRALRDEPERLRAYVRKHRDRLARVSWNSLAPARLTADVVQGIAWEELQTFEARHAEIFSEMDRALFHVNYAV